MFGTPPWHLFPRSCHRTGHVPGLALLTELPAHNFTARRSNCNALPRLATVSGRKTMKHYSRNSLLPLAVCLLISIDTMLPTALAQSLPARININVVEGEGVSSGVRQRV